MVIEISINKFVDRTPENLEKLLSIEGLFQQNEKYFVDLKYLKDLNSFLQKIQKTFGFYADILVLPDPLEIFIDFNLQE